MLNSSQYAGASFNRLKEKITKIPLLTHIVAYKQNFFAGLRGSVIGSFCGLVPHINNTLSSNLSYFVEQKIGRKNNSYNENGDMKSLVSAETANNSATLMTLMPLLMLGIPITVSEAVLLNILDRNLILVNYTTTITSGLFYELSFYFVLANAIGLCVAWPLVNHIHILYRIPLKVLFSIIMLILTMLLTYVGYTHGNVGYYFGVFLALAPIGYLLRKKDTLVIILAFILSDKIVSAVYRGYIIFFS